MKEDVDEGGTKEETLEKCEECGEFSVVVISRCRTCIECGVSTCGI